MSLGAAAASIVHVPRQESVYFVNTCMEVVPSHDNLRPSAVEGDVLQWDGVLAFICDELVHIQALRPVCRLCATDATAHVLCHLAFHENNIVLDPYSDPRVPIWCMCIAMFEY